MSARIGRPRAINWLWVDQIFAVALALDLGLEAAFAPGVPSSHRLVTVAVAAPFAATIAVRRRWPSTALLFGVGLALVQQLFHGQLFTTLPSESAEFVPILCAYGVGAWVERRRGVLTIAAAGALLYGLGAVATAEHVAGAPGWVGGVGLSCFFLIPPWVVGCIVRERNRRADAFAALERQTILERGQRERAAVAEERETIGRELQDIIAHSVSVMVIQAGGARRLMGEQPERARESILAVEQTGRETLAEMRRLLGVLRHDDDPRALSPQPGLAQLDDLLERLQARGLACEISGIPPVELTPGIDLVAYRVIEAALVAAAEHGGSDARVAVNTSSRELELEVAAFGASDLAAGDLRLVAERVALYDGRLGLVGGERQVLVRCWLPLGAAVAV